MNWRDKGAWGLYLSLLGNLAALGIVTLVPVQLIIYGQPADQLLYTAQVNQRAVQFSFGAIIIGYILQIWDRSSKGK